MSVALYLKLILSALIGGAAQAKIAIIQEGAQVQTNRFASIPLHVILNVLSLGETLELAGRF